MWIMLTVKLPTRPSPPKMSIHWSTPWPDDVYAKKQKNRSKEMQKYGYDPSLSIYDVDPSDRVVIDELDRPEPNWTGARRIHFCGQDIRVFPHEFTAVKPENMSVYITGDESSHELVPDSVAQDTIDKHVIKGDLRPIRDAALLDGCNENQATLVALGQDITIPDGDFDPIGWYRCKREYALIFCEEWEIEEHVEYISEST